jgi:hypothetical protein
VSGSDSHPPPLFNDQKFAADSAIWHFGITYHAAKDITKNDSSIGG